MEKVLLLGENRRETILYQSNAIPLCISTDHFDDYRQREWPCHWHEEFEFAVVLKGSILYTIYDSDNMTPVCPLHAGDGIFISAGTFHSTRALETGTKIVSIAFPLAFFERKLFDTFFNQNIQPIIDSGITHYVLENENCNHSAVLSSIRELALLDSQEIGYELHCVELICRIWRLLTTLVINRNSPSEADLRNLLQGQRVRQMLSYIHTNYNRRITVEEIAEAASISRTEAFRCFKAILRKTPVEYLLEYRLSMAAALLSNTEIPLLEVAENCGFNSSSYFGKMFRQQCGMTPKKYRTLTSYSNK